MTEIKFCGLTRPDDAAMAGALGAAYAGVIFADGPRTLTPERASVVLTGLPAHVRRVGVFAKRPPREIAEVAAQVALDVVQLHGDPTAGDVAALRTLFHGEVWSVSRISGTVLPDRVVDLFEIADAVVLDAFVADRLGGNGVALAWTDIARAVNAARGSRRLVLAGGLRAETVAAAIGALRPSVVDVSSGVESAPGIKDHSRMRAFRDAVAAATEQG